MKEYVRKETVERDGVMRDIMINWSFEGSQAVPACPPHRGTSEVG
jgi:hypothetical protein